MTFGSEKQGIKLRLIHCHRLYCLDCAGRFRFAFVERERSVEPYGEGRAMTEDQRQKIIKLLTAAENLATDLQEEKLAYFIERAIDEARAGFYPLKGQAPYFPG